MSTLTAFKTLSTRAKYGSAAPVLALLSLCSALGGCKRDAADSSASGSNGAPAAMTPSAEARQLFARRCSVCHGGDGRGNGPTSAMLNPRPRAFNDKQWQASVDDAHLARVIVQGGSAAKLSASMPSNPDLGAKPEVLAELIKLVRGFAK